MTYDQRLASDPKRSVWVSASAGTGKTKVLTDRVLRLLLSGVGPGGILCLTYTKAAAAEMQARIERQLGQWVVAADEALAQSLETIGEVPSAHTLLRARRLFAEVLDAPDRLRVQTIHSFCQSLIARFPIEAGVPPHITLIDDRDAEEMFAEARAHIFSDARKSNPRLVRALEKLARSIAESSLTELLQKIIAERRKFTPWLEAKGGVDHFLVALHKVTGLKAGTTQTLLMEKHFVYTADEERALRGIAAGLQVAQGVTNLKTAAAIAGWMEARADLAAYCNALVTKEGTVRTRLYTKDAAEAMGHMADVLQREAARVMEYLQQSRTLKLIESSESMMVLATALLEHYRREKVKHGVMDYDDLILLAVQLLRRSNAAAWVLFKLDGRIDHLLVDEAQDTSPEQWQIVESLVSEFFSGEGARRPGRTMFVVGDEKQSIFSFQGARPASFEHMRLTLSAKAKVAGQEFSHVRLGTSFRSTEAVLMAVDTVFASAQAREGLVFAEAVIAHQAHRVAQAGRVEIWPLVEGEVQERHAIWDEPKQRDFSPPPEQVLAQQIAGEISGWLVTGRRLAAKGRKVQPADIMILVQRRGRFAAAMLRALKRAGIPVAGADRLVITDHIAVADCMAMADFLLLPQDDLTLATLMKSPLLGMTEEELFTLAHGRGTKTLWERLREHGGFEEVTTLLQDMLARADYMAPFELFSHLLVTLGRREAIAARLGQEADDPLNEFLSLALHYERNHPPSLQGFMHWLRSSDSEIKRDMEKGRNEVRILTVHASKGLQAPIIFMPDTTRLPRGPANLQWLGGEPALPIWSDRADNDDSHMEQQKQRARAEALDEYRRLLYVAMTRAEDELYICGWKGMKETVAGNWYELIRTALAAHESCKQQGDRLILQLGEAGAGLVEEVAQTALQKLPAWAKQAAPEESVPSRPLSPSRMEETMMVAQAPSSAAARARGVLVHRLLQHLPACAPTDRESVTDKFMQRYGAELALAEQREVRRMVAAVLDHPQFAAVFAPGSVAEVPVVGVVQGKDGKPVTIAGQVDRLAVTPDKVLIIDFKTGKEIPSHANLVTQAYVRQMESYRALIQGVYPDKSVECAILWTAGPVLMTLPGGD